MASTSPTNRDPPCQSSPLPSISYLDDFLSDICNDDINSVYKVGNESFICTAVEGTGAQDTVDEVGTEIFTGAPETRTDETSDELSTMFGIMTLEEFLFRAGVIEKNVKRTSREVEDEYKAMHRKERRRFKNRRSAATFRDGKQVKNL